MGASRYTRQTRLPEVGAEGQARLERTEIELSTRGAAAQIERAYLEAAGARVREGGGEGPALPIEVRDPAARDVALGAYAALCALRRVWLEKA